MDDADNKSQGTVIRGVTIRPDTMIWRRKPISVTSDIGALTIMHGALQAAIGDPDDAATVQRAYLNAIRDIDRSDTVST
jgi:hypothetical protein